MRITKKQRERAEFLLNEAETALTTLCNQPLNLDTATRLAAEAAIDTIKAAHSSLASQPWESF